MNPFNAALRTHPTQELPSGDDRAGPAATHGPGKAGEQRRSSISAELIARDLGLEIETTLEEGISETADWFRKNEP